ncbi:MAG: hypothetical protein J5379_05745 [Clostridiales bacterium]|nr:hypothetical protein [Clostridiales bacterium]
MIKKWLRIRLPYTIIVTLIICMISSVLFEKYMRIHAENRYRTSTFTDTRIDYDLPFPSEGQAEELIDLEFCEEVLGYYYVSDVLEIDGKEVPANLIMTDWDGLSLTPFSAERIIEDGTFDSDDEIRIGYDFARENHLSLGDTVLFRGYEITVSDIFEEDVYRHAQVVALSMGSGLDYYVQSLFNGYSGVFINVADGHEAEAKAYVEQYRPRGGPKDALGIVTEEGRISYYTAEGESVTCEVVDFKSYLNDVELESANHIWIGATILFAGMVLARILLFQREKERVAVDVFPRRNQLLYYFLTMLLEIMVSSLWFVIAGVVYRSSAKYYVMRSLLQSTLKVAILVVFAVDILNFILNLMQSSREEEEDDEL